jgi:hypothetical protein
VNAAKALLLQTAPPTNRISGMAKSGDRRQYRYGGGEFEPPAAVVETPSPIPLWPESPQFGPYVLQLERPSILKARSMFLGALQGAEPDVLSSLRENVFPTLDSLVNGEAINKNAALFTPFIFEWRQVELTKSLRVLRAALLEWSRNWNLTDTWCLEWAVQTLSWWSQRRFEEHDDWYHEDLSGVPSPKFQFRDFEMKCHWDVGSELKADFVARTITEFEQNLARYIRDSKAFAKAHGFVPAPALRELEHFFWLARYQVSGETAKDIARGRDIGGCWSSDGSTAKEQRKIGAEREAATQRVKKGLSRLANFIGLTLRDRRSASQI